MRKSVTLLCAGLTIGLCSCVHRAQVQRPPQSTRVSSLWSGPVTYGDGATVNKRLRPVSGTPYPQRQSLKSKLAQRMTERRAAMSARSGQRYAQFQPGAPRGYRETPMASRWNQAGRMDPLRMQPPGLEPLAGESARRVSMRMPETGTDGPLAAGRTGTADPDGDSFFTTPQGGAAPLAEVEPEKAPPSQNPERDKANPERQEKAPALPNGVAKGGQNSGGEFDHLPFGVPVPGKAGYVTLAGKRDDLPEIDVRGIASGTPVEIPDLEAPGASIQFRVP